MPPANFVCSSASVPALDRLEEALLGAAGQQDTLVLLHGTLGQGKTALLGLAQRRFEEEGLGVVRVDVAGVSGPVGFWCAVREAVKEQLTGAARAALDLRSPDDDCLLYVEAWAHDLLRRTVLLIDSYQSATSPEMDLALAELLENHPHLSAVVASTAFIVLGGPVVAARVPTTIINVDEVEVDGTQSAGPAVPEKETKVSAETFALGEEVAQLRTAERAAVRALSLLGPTSLSVLCSLLELPAAQCMEVLSGLERRGLVKRWRTEGRTIHSVGSVASAALETAGLALEGEEAQDLRVRHALHLAAEDPVTALGLLVQIGNVEASDQVADDHFPVLLAAGARTHQLLADLELEELRKAPMLLGLRTHLAIQHRLEPIEDAEVLASLLRAALLASEEPQKKVPGRVGSGLPVDRQAVLMGTERALGNWNEALRHAAELEVRVAEHDHHDLFHRQGNPPDEILGLPLLCVQVGLTALLGGQLDLALRCTARGFSYAEENGDLRNQVNASFQLSLLHSIAFSIGGGGEAQRDAEAILHSSRQTVAGDAKVAEGISRSLQQFLGGDAAGALGTLRALGPRIGRSELWPVALVVCARFLHHLEGPLAGLRFIQDRASKQRTTTPISPFAHNMLASRAADLATVAGEISVARALIDAELREREGVLPHVSRARLKLMIGDTSGAVESLQQALYHPQQHVRSTDFELLAATIWFTVGDTARAFQALDKAAPALVQAAPATLTAWIPFGPLRELAVAARDAGHTDVLAHVDAIPEGLRPVAVEPLSTAEERTLRAVAGADTIAEGAELLGLSENTVKYHLRNVYKKLEVGSKTEAVRIARAWGLLGAEPTGEVEEARDGL